MNRKALPMKVTINGWKDWNEKLSKVEKLLWWASELVECQLSY